MKTDFAKLDSHRRKEHARNGLARQIGATDAQCDHIDYPIYGPTDEEIKIVEGMAK